MKTPSLKISRVILGAVLSSLIIFPTTNASATPNFGDRIASFTVSDQSGGSSAHFSHD
jgi:hypothetical protein